MKKENSAISMSESPFLFGVLLPILAVLFDPYIFQGEGIFSRWTGAAYALIAVGVLSMSYWLLSRSASSYLAGILTVCSFLSFVLGVLILPASFIGIFFFGIGLLGFIPFATSYIFYKSATFVWREAINTKNKLSKFVAGIAFVILVIFSCQISAQKILERTVAVIANAEVLTSSTDNMVLLVAEALGLQRNLVEVWRNESDSERALNISNFYKARYGVEIDMDWMLS